MGGGLGVGVGKLCYFLLFSDAKKIPNTILNLIQRMEKNFEKMRGFLVKVVNNIARI